jgi:RNA polymerase sigma-70 factor (ECF subfamily)
MDCFVTVAPRNDKLGLHLPPTRFVNQSEKAVRIFALRRLIKVMSPTSSPESLFQAWLEEHRGIVVKVTRSFASTPADAADLHQELLLQLWISLSSYAGQAKPSTWIYRVCLNTALTWRRGASRREKRIEPEADIARVATEAASPAERAGERELLEKLYAAIHALPGFDRALVLLSLDGLAYREIAEITGLTENHVGVALTRARKRLAALLKGVTDEL